MSMGGPCGFPEQNLKVVARNRNGRLASCPKTSDAPVAGYRVGASGRREAGEDILEMEEVGGSESIARYIHGVDGT
jgi:hypothetical protein